MTEEALAVIGMLPQVIVLVARGAFINPFVQRVGLDRAAWLSAASVVFGIAVIGTILAGLFTGDIATSSWSAQQTAEFREAVTIAGVALTVLAAALVGWGIVRARRSFRDFFCRFSSWQCPRIV